MKVELFEEPSLVDGSLWSEIGMRRRSRLMLLHHLRLWANKILVKKPSHKCVGPDVGTSHALVNILEKSLSLLLRGAQQFYSVGPPLIEVSLH